VPAGAEPPAAELPGHAGVWVWGRLPVPYLLGGTKDEFVGGVT